MLSSTTLRQHGRFGDDVFGYITLRQEEKVLLSKAQKYRNVVFERG